tara:strand:- start:97 stop:1155 length:1059 start_codon:yes stop_codon:yes gene_type:complete
MKFYTYICLLLLTPLFSIAQLGDYYYSDNHPKAKGLNFQVKSPIGFEQKEGVRPNIVQKWDKGSGDNFESFMIIVYEDEYLTEYSIEDYKNTFKDKDTRDEYLSEYPLNISNSKYYVIDNYPGVVFEGYQDVERTDKRIRAYLIQSQVVVGKYSFSLQFFTPNKDAIDSNRELFNEIANSIVFPDQYNPFTSAQVRDFEVMNFKINIPEGYVVDENTEESVILTNDNTLISLSYFKMDSSKVKYDDLIQLSKLMGKDSLAKIATTDDVEVDGIKIPYSLVMGSRGSFNLISTSFSGFTTTGYLFVVTCTELIKMEDFSNVDATKIANKTGEIGGEIVYDILKSGYLMNLNNN